MTLEILVECDAETLLKMDDATLKKHFEKDLTVTRPELAPKPQPKTQAVPVYVSPKKAALLSLLQADGVDLSFMRKRKK